MKVAGKAFVASMMLLMGEAARGELKPTSEANRDEQATADFKFKTIRRPSKTDAANEAKFILLDGRRDANGGRLDVLNDGRAPADSDEPNNNFFFAAGTNGGRLLVDLGKLTEIKQIVTYSWHPAERGPQVYKLYAADPDAKDFDPQSGKAENPAESGWKLLASVDTRPEGAEPGGQYAVRLGDRKENPVGKHRYLLFHIARTEGHQWFDNTFYSEIDILDGKKHPPAKEAKSDQVAAADVLKIGDKYEITFDASEAPELKPWIDSKLKPACSTWYPKIVDMLPSEDFTAPTRFTIVFEKDMRGVAYTAGRDVHCAVNWFQDNLDGEAAGAVVHELVHVVQQYGRTRGGNRNPGWMVEGLADYIRWFLYEPEKLRPKPDPARAKYTDSYRTTGAFLDYVVREHGAEIIEKFNAAMREGKYNESLWEDFTGKSVEQLWAEYVRTLRDRTEKP